MSFRSLQNKFKAFGIIPMPSYFRKKAILKFTRHSLGKLEELLHSCDYTLRYEKGNFSSASCRLHDNRVIVINKFLNVEQRNLVLIDLIVELDLQNESWTAKQAVLVDRLQEWKQKKLQLED